MKTFFIRWILELLLFVVLIIAILMPSTHDNIVMFYMQAMGMILVLIIAAFVFHWEEKKLVRYLEDDAVDTYIHEINTRLTEEDRAALIHRLVMGDTFAGSERSGAERSEAELSERGGKRVHKNKPNHEDRTLFNSGD